MPSKTDILHTALLTALICATGALIACNGPGDREAPAFVEQFTGPPAAQIAFVQVPGEEGPDTLYPAGESLEFVLVPTGERYVGTDCSRAESYEMPACVFRLDYVLYMATTEVTYSQFLMVVGRWPGGVVRISDIAQFPARVTWEETQEFCARYEELLEADTGKAWLCRLPREAEWEYAACYGRPPWEEWWPARREFSWLVYPHDDDVYAPGEPPTSRPVRHRVKPNALGLYNMYDNAREWCDGWLTDSVTEMLAAGWRADYAGQDHPKRGNHGGILLDYDQCRPSVRDEGDTTPATPAGFRIVVLPEPQP